jgi:hypothetical protein
MKMAVFWVVAPCSLVEVYQRFRGPCCLHHRPDVHNRRRENLKSYLVSVIFAHLHDEVKVQICYFGRKSTKQMQTKS